MPDNELYGLDEWLEQVDPPGGNARGGWPSSRLSRLRRQLNAHVARARQNWALAIFADRGQDALRRYFVFHQQLIGLALTRLEKAGDRIGDDVCGTAPSGRQLLITYASGQLTGLIDHLLAYYPEFFDHDLAAPSAYREELSRREFSARQRVLNILQTEKIDPVLSALLTGFLEQCYHHDHAFTYRTVFYTVRITTALNSMMQELSFPEIQPAMIRTLLEHNFNHLSFFAWYTTDCRAATAQEDLPVRISACLRRKQQLQAYQQREVPAYDPSWPSLAHLLYHWLLEEIQSLQFMLQQQSQSAAPQAAPKILLNMPVAYLACLIRLFCDGEWIKNHSLTEIFAFAAQNFQSKRMESISPKSLSKEYYTISQRTAARVQGLLQDMITRINREYFPAWAAISVFYFLY